MKNITITMMLTFSILTVAFSQEYRNALGLRGGSTSGLVYRNFSQPDIAQEFIFSHSDQGLQFTVVMEKFKLIPQEKLKNTYFFHGFGAHAGYRNIYKEYKIEDFHNNFQTYYKHHTALVAGVDYIFGAEYFIPRLPLSVGLNIKPYIELATPLLLRADFWDVGVTIKYCFDHPINEIWNELLTSK